MMLTFPSAGITQIRFEGLVERSTSQRALRTPTAILLPVALFFPGISAVVIAVDFPEAEAVMLDPFQPFQPFGAFPRVSLGNDEAQRTAVIRRQIGSVMPVGDQDVLVGKHLDRQARRITGVAVGDHVLGAGT